MSLMIEVLGVDLELDKFAKNLLEWAEVRDNLPLYSGETKIAPYASDLKRFIETLHANMQQLKDSGCDLEGVAKDLIEILNLLARDVGTPMIENGWKYVVTKDGRDAGPEFAERFFGVRTGYQQRIHLPNFGNSCVMFSNKYATQYPTQSTKRGAEDSLIEDESRSGRPVGMYE